jgi:Stress responsive A/B Barrel Domain
MKFTLILTLLFAMAISANAQNKPMKNNGKKPLIRSQKLLRHVVIFKFNDSSTPAEVENVAKTFAALYGKVPQIAAFEWGVNMSQEHFDQGFTHCFILSFKSEKEAADYQAHQAHKDFQTVLKPHMEKVFVVDYWMK